jgi:hypothetical protein
LDGKRFWLFLGEFMMNLAINSSNVKTSVYALGKVEAASGQTQKNTFQDVLSEVFQNKSAPNKIMALSGANYVFNAADIEPETEIGIENETDETLRETAEVIRQAPSKSVYDMTLDEIMAHYSVTIEINGKKVKQMTDEYLAAIGYNVDALKANALDVDLSVFAISGSGFVPRYVVPMGNYDANYYTDYTATVTRENISRTTANNAALDYRAPNISPALNNTHISNSNSHNASENTLSISKGAENSATVASKGSKTPVSVNNGQISPNDESALTEQRINHINTHAISENTGNKESIAKIAENAALRMRLMSDLNIWEQENKDEKK